MFLHLTVCKQKTVLKQMTVCQQKLSTYAKQNCLKLNKTI